MRLFWLLPLIVPSDNVDTSALPNYGPEVVRPDQTLEPSVSVDEKKLNCKFTTATELLRGVRDSAGAFGPLKSIARSLYFILGNCEVWLPSRTLNSQCLQSF